MALRERPGGGARGATRPTSNAGDQVPTHAAEGSPYQTKPFEVVPDNLYGAYARYSLSIRRRDIWQSALQAREPIPCRRQLTSNETYGGPTPPIVLSTPCPAT